MFQASALPMENLDDVILDMGWSYFADVYAELGEVSLGGGFGRHLGHIIEGSDAATSL